MIKICPICKAMSNFPTDPLPPGAYDASSDPCQPCMQERKMRIFKYPLPIVYDSGLATWTSTPKVPLPKGAKILSVGLQGTKAVLWALVQSENLQEQRQLYILATGVDLPPGAEGARFIGTLIFGGSSGIVLHVFE